MFVLSGVKNAVGSTIARHRRSPLVMAMHNVTSFFESAWRNEGSEFAVNGEQSVLEKLEPANFQLAIDVGANLGHWFRSAVELWPNCRVHAFEVAPSTFKSMELETRLMPGRERVELHNLGLSDASGTQTMYYFPDHPQLTCDLPRHDSYKAVPFDANLTTLDAFCREKKIDAIDFLKIDVEGAEFRVLQGASELMNAQRIACIQFEYGAFSIQTRFLLQDYYAALSDRYVIGKIFPNYIAFGDYDWRAEDFRFSNYLCVAKSRSDLQQLLLK